MGKAETTAQKKNAYEILGVISQAVFKELIVAQGDDALKYTIVGKFNRPLLSTLAVIAARSIMHNPRLNVVLKKKQASTEQTQGS